jgi:DNA-directed RNA polymerase specialized sigma24 family protein
MPPAKRFHVLAQEDLDRLLTWLDPDRERASYVYEKVRWRLITILASRGCSIPEELADETIDRVARRVTDIQETYVGDKTIYFLGVANNVHHEYLKRPALPLVSASRATAEESRNKEQTHECLEVCLNKLPLDSRNLIERYYAEERQAKIDLRKRIADELGIGSGTLRLRALRIRERLQQCIENCLDA